MEYDNRNSVTLFKNDRKRKDSDPDYTGTWVDEDGIEHWASCWINVAKSGKKFMRVSRGQAKEQQQPRDYPDRQQRSFAEQSGASAEPDDFQDDIPF